MVSDTRSNKPQRSRQQTAGQISRPLSSPMKQTALIYDARGNGGVKRALRSRENIKTE